MITSSPSLPTPIKKVMYKWQKFSLLLLLICGSVFPLSAQEYDILIKGGHLMDP